MSVFDTYQLNQQMDREVAPDQQELDEARREKFLSEDEAKRNMKEFYGGYSQLQLYEKLQKQGIESGEYKVYLKKANFTKTSGGKPIVRFTFRLAEEYIFSPDEGHEDVALKNVTINSQTSAEWNSTANMDFAIRTMAGYFQILNIPEPKDVSEVTHENLAKTITKFVEENEVEIPVRVKTTKLTSDRGTAVFYNVTPILR